MATDARTELFYFENAPVNGGVPENNKFHAEGTSYYNTNPYTAAQIDAVLSGSGNGTILLNAVVTQYSTPGSLAVAGKAALIAGTGLAMSLGAPTARAVCDVVVLSISSGSVVITTAPGVTFDGTNNTATATVADSKLVVGYSSATRWLIQEARGFAFTSA